LTHASLAAVDIDNTHAAWPTWPASKDNYTTNWTHLATT